MLLRDSIGNGKADVVRPFGKGSGPYGLAYRQDDGLVADTSGIWKLPYDEDQTRTASTSSKLTEHQPLTARGAFGGKGSHAPGGHVTRSLAIDPKDGSLYVG